MRYLICFFLTLASIYHTCAQTTFESRQFISKALNEKYVGKEELVSQLVNLEFSHLWMINDKAILGFIGDDYNRIKIKYISIIKNINNPNLYYICGKDQVDSDIHTFLGTIELLNIRKIINPEKFKLYEEAKRQNDEKVAKLLSRDQFVAIARYIYYEDSSCLNRGYFDGVMKSKFCIDGNTILFDSTESDNDLYSNNQCVGTWTSYTNKTTKRCNWGEYRIPCSGDLDIGEGDFCPNIKYYDKGWKSYYKAVFLNDSVAQKEEQKIWWK
jgi:hypothetical protein